MHNTIQLIPFFCRKVCLSLSHLVPGILGPKVGLIFHQCSINAKSCVQISLSRKSYHKRGICSVILHSRQINLYLPWKKNTNVLISLSLPRSHCVVLTHTVATLYRCITVFAPNVSPKCIINRFEAFCINFLFDFQSNWPHFSLILDLFDPSFSQNLRSDLVQIFFTCWTRLLKILWSPPPPPPPPFHLDTKPLSLTKSDSLITRPTCNPLKGWLIGQNIFSGLGVCSIMSLTSVGRCNSTYKGLSDGYMVTATSYYIVNKI